MAKTEPGGGAASGKNSKPLVAMGIALGLAGGGGAFAATYFGVLEDILPGGKAVASETASEIDTAFVPIDPLVISLGPDTGNRHLRFKAEIEVVPSEAENVAKLMPRILDTLNGYLRAVKPSDLEEPSSLVRLRSHMLHRIMVMVGEERVRDLLITEFVLS